jgi:hypothetical protein
MYFFHGLTYADLISMPIPEVLAMEKESKRIAEQLKREASG